MKFSFYDGILYDNSFYSLKDEFVNSQYPNSTIFNSSSQLCFDFLCAKSAKAIFILSNDLESQLVLEQSKEQRILKIEHAISLIEYYNEKLKKVEEDDRLIVLLFTDDLVSFKYDIKEKYKYLFINSIVETCIPKIQWLGKTNVLATLLYDLWKGQDKGKGKASTPPMMKADKKDLEKLLIDNFIDSKGQPLTIATISDYLNTSKPEKRAKNGSRIEL